jgi:hypothetical protein
MQSNPNRTERKGGAEDGSRTDTRREAELTQLTRQILSGTGTRKWRALIARAQKIERATWQQWLELNIARRRADTEWIRRHSCGLPQEVRKELRETARALSLLERQERLALQNEALKRRIQAFVDGSPQPKEELSLALDLLAETAAARRDDMARAVKEGRPLPFVEIPDSMKGEELLHRLGLRPRMLVDTDKKKRALLKAASAAGYPPPDIEVVAKPRQLRTLEKEYCRCRSLFAALTG